MLRKEAFEVLALKPGATPAEIKEAYRDLVKVWHPDRFANDLRLRQKAKFQLKVVTVRTTVGYIPVGFTEVWEYC